MAETAYITDAGVLLPDTADVLAQVQDEWRAALGADLVVTTDTPQGVLIAAETAARQAVLRNNAQLANQINPDLAGGVFLDAICALTGLGRTAASHSVVEGVTVTGVPGTVIPAGAVARTSDGDQFATTGAVTIGADGRAAATFQAVEAGAVPCPAGALAHIVTAVLGWESVDNPAAAALGRVRQSDASLRAQRRRTLALQGISMAQAITSALYAVDGVASLVFRENVAAAAQVIDGIAMPAHSVWACVHGGTDADVAAALLANKSCGCAWAGAVTVTVPDPTSGQTYAVAFDRPRAVPIKVRLTVRAAGALADAAGDVRAAVLAWAGAADDGLPGLRVGGTVSPFDIATAVTTGVDGIQVARVELSTVAADAFAVAELPMALDQIATLGTGNIAVVSL